MTMSQIKARASECIAPAALSEGAYLGDVVAWREGQGNEHGVEVYLHVSLVLPFRDTPVLVAALDTRRANEPTYQLGDRVRLEVSKHRASARLGDVQTYIDVDRLDRLDRLA
jgi:hypothetical protein